MKPDSRLARLGENIDQFKERAESNRQLAYERRIVRKLLTAAKVDRSVLVHMFDDESADHLTFSWLHEEYPSLPIRLMSHEIWKPSLSDFFRITTKKNSFWTKWREVEEFFQDESRPIGCIFPMPAETGLGSAIMHNADMLPWFNPEAPRDFVCMSRLYAQDNTQVILELMPSFIDRLCAVWEVT